MKSRQLGVVITGASSGLGRAMAAGFLRYGDRVVICGRNMTRLESALRALKRLYPAGEIHGMAVDVSDPDQAAAFTEFAVSKIGRIDRWINNAGTAGLMRQTLVELDLSDIAETCSTNLSGTMMMCAEAVRVMNRQEPTGEKPDAHIFNMGFSASGFRLSPTALPHRVSKRAVALCTSLLKKELRVSGIDRIGVHELSPGLVLTALLLRGADLKQRRFFDKMAETPERVSSVLVPAVRGVRSRGETVRFTSSFRMILRLLTSWGRGERFFDLEGKRRIGTGG